MPPLKELNCIHEKTELEETTEEAIEDFVRADFLEQCIDITHDEAIQLAEEINKDESLKNVTNDDIYELIKLIYKTTNSVKTEQIEQTSDINFMKLHHTKLNLFMSLALLSAGYVIGTQHDSISPYGKVAWDFITSFIK